MNRRDLVQLLGSLVGSAGLSSMTADQLFARGQAINARMPPGNGRGPFTPHQFDTVGRVTDLIIPATDTPGALEAGVPGFIAIIVGEWYTAPDRDRFMAGLADLDARSNQDSGRDFVSGSEADQTRLLQILDDEVSLLRAQNGKLDNNFFHRIKGLTLYGYYTSEIGMTRELHYQVIPGRYDPCSRP
ncbi:MAG: gluconate 2-dehydrogenase subunit 3 family protein [Gemmatimonadota bacterium]